MVGIFFGRNIFELSNQLVIMWSAVVHDNWRAAALINYARLDIDIIRTIKQLFADSLVTDRMPERAAVIKKFITDRVDCIYILEMCNFPTLIFTGCIDPPELDHKFVSLYYVRGYELRITINNDGLKKIYKVIDIDRLIMNLARAGGRIQVEDTDGHFMNSIYAHYAIADIVDEYGSPWREHKPQCKANSCAII